LGGYFIGIFYYFAFLNHENNKKIFIENYFLDFEKYFNEEKSNEIDLFFEKYYKDPVDTFLNKGGTLFEEGKYKEAIIIYNRALKINLEDLDLLFYKALALFKLGKYKETIRIYNKILKLDPRHLGAIQNKSLTLVILGLNLYELNKYNEAIDVYNKALRINSKYPEIFFYKGEALYKLKKYKESIREYNKSLKIDKEKDRIQLIPENLEQLIRDDGSNLDYFSNPDYFFTLYKKGSALFNLGRYREAIVSFDKALKIDSNNLKTLYIKGVALYRLNKNMEAIKIYNKILEMTPKNYKVFHYKALALFKLDRHEEAIKIYDESLELSSEDFLLINRFKINTLVKLSQMLLAMSRYEDVINICDKVLEIKLKYPDKNFLDESMNRIINCAKNFALNKIKDNKK